MTTGSESSGGGALRRLDVVELIIDICSGLLMLFLFGPFFYALKFTSPASPPPTFRDLVLGIFPSFLGLFKDLSLTTITPWLLLGSALILGFLSRGVFILYNILPINKWAERGITRLSVLQIGKWHGLAANWTHSEVTNRLLDRNPFGRVGDPQYARYRASLLDPSSDLNNSKAYWDYEMFLFLRSSHFYGLLLTFSSAYFIYGISVGIALRFHIHMIDFCVWAGVFIVASAISMGLLQETIIHGVAFVTIDDLLYKDFDGLRRPSGRDSQA